MPHLSADQWREIAFRLFRAVGTEPPIARRVADALVEGNLMGHDSHGVIRLLEYIPRVQRGDLHPNAQPEVIRETSTTAMVDGHWGFGQVAAKFAMEVAIAKARQSGLSAVGLVHSHHVGRLGEYAQMAAEAGMVAFLFANSGPRGGWVTPYGGIGRVFGTNPLAIGIPARRHPPILLDFATSAGAEGKIRFARSKGERIPEGWVIDKEGRPTTDPNALYKGGALLPFGGHKGYALALAIDLIGGALTGAGCASLPEYVAGNGLFMIVVDVATFQPPDQFYDMVDRLIDRVKGVPKAPGVEEILVPGEPERRTWARRAVEGFAVPDTTWNELLELAARLGVHLEDVVC